MKKDFYLEPRGIASYFEKEWFDKFLKQSSTVDFEFAEFNPGRIYSEFNEVVARAILSVCKVKGLKPRQYLEIGPGLGRTFYEIVQTSVSIQNAILVEPSKNLAMSLDKIFIVGGPCSFPILKGIGEITDVSFNSSEISNRCSQISKTIIQKKFEDIVEEDLQADMVVCLNVLDQCESPVELLHFLKQNTRRGGLLAVSCTFQWQKKYLGSANSPFKNLRSQFNEGWEILDEKNEPFHLRLNERCWHTFLSQILFLQKL